ncbi:unnamed protein product [Meloidogyne enterolobii]|uniref:Uncharacterized protein n=1 Tax=Meloidogyne enterolobii TaxID=390850 RepID=A0ACB0XNN0_MELEN
MGVGAEKAGNHKGFRRCSTRWYNFYFELFTHSSKCSLQIDQTENLREDWFQRNGQILISIYCKGAIIEGTKIDTDGLNLKAKIKFNFGDKETLREYELFGEIIPSESMVLISERKVEIVLKQVNKDAWPRLTYK